MIEKFTVEDITFKNPRMQDSVLSEIGELKNNGSEFNNVSKVPQVAIIERAIKYYEENAEGEFKVLYSATANWLRKLLVRPKNKVPVNEAEIEEVTIDEIEVEEDKG